MSNFILPASDAFRDAPPHAVYTRQRWGDKWTPRPGLYCNMVRWASGTVRPEAELVWTYAEVMLPGESAYIYRAPLNLLGQYVKVEIQQPAPAAPLRWHGILTEDARQRAGAIQTLIEGDLVRRETGLQVLSAEGLDLLLMREMMTSSHVCTAAGMDKLIRRGLTFNAPNVCGDPGNIGGQIEGVNGFADSLYAAYHWTTKTILEYLLHWHAPKAALGDQPIRWELSLNAKLVAPDWDTPVIKTHGRSLRAIIDELVNPSKGFSWQLLVANDGPDPTILLDVFPFQPAALELPSGLTQPGNQNLVELGEQGLDLDAAVDARVSLRKSDHQRVDQVVVRGARKRVVASFSSADETLVPDWDLEHETAYQSGPGGLAGLDIDEQQKRLREFRAIDELERVYAWFRVPTDWDGQVGGGEGPYVVPKTACAPLDEESGEDESWHMPELRFDRYLPKGLSLSAPTSSPPSLRALFGIIKTSGTRGVDILKYTYLEQLAICSEIEDTGDGAGRKWSVSVRAQPHAPGVILNVSNGPQHLLAALQFTPYPYEDLDEPGQLNWFDVIITAMFELDAQVEQRWPPAPNLDAGPDVIRRIYIDLGEKARLDWVHAGAVIDLAEGRPVYLNGSTPGGDGQWVQDDRTLMRDLARMVYEWYGTPRQAFTLVLSQVTGLLSVGQLITRIGSGDTAVEVNACVTGVEIDLLAVRTQISTGLAELDPLEFVGDQLGV